MSVTVTEQPHPQHLRALARANAVRLARAELKRRISEEEVTAGEVFAQCPWEAASMTVADVLMSQRRWGSAAGPAAPGPAAPRRPPAPLRDQPLLAPLPLEHAERAVELLALVGRHHARAQERTAARDGGGERDVRVEPGVV